MSTPTPDLRQQLAETLQVASHGMWTWQALDLADSLITGPLAPQLAALQAVRELHRPDGDNCCDGCALDWPCPTRRALDGAGSGACDRHTDG